MVSADGELTVVELFSIKVAIFSCLRSFLQDPRELESLEQWFLTFLKFQGTLLIIRKICGTPKLMIQNTNKNMPRRNRYILENILLNRYILANILLNRYILENILLNRYILANILLNIFKFYILKYIIKIEKNLPFLIHFKIYSLYI